MMRNMTKMRMVNSKKNEHLHLEAEYLQKKTN